MPHAITLTFLAALALPAWADDKPAEDEKLYGTWVIDGSALLVPRDFAPQVNGLLYFYKEGAIATKRLTLADWRGGYTTAPIEGKNFRLLDRFEVKAGKPVEDTRLKAIYRIEGDTLTLVFVDKGKVRPTSLDAKDAVILSYMRPKP
jgi:hypothetical protein